MYSQVSNHSSEGEGSPSHDTMKSLVGMVEASLLARLEDEKAPLDRISVQVLGLSARGYNALKNSTIDTIQRLINRTESDLRGFIIALRQRPCPLMLINEQFIRLFTRN